MDSPEMCFDHVVYEWVMLNVEKQGPKMALAMEIIADKRHVIIHVAQSSLCATREGDDLSSTLQSLGSRIPTSSANQLLTIQFHTRNTLPDLVLLLLFDDFLFILFIITSLILGNRASEESISDSQNQDEPEDVDSLQSEEQGESDDLRNPAFVLLCFPVEFVRADCAEASQGCPENVQVEVVAEVEPYTNEETKVRASDG